MYRKLLYFCVKILKENYNVGTVRKEVFIMAADEKEIEQTAMIDRKMDQVFDWAKGNDMPIRVAIWNHEMEANGRDTMKTEAAVKWILKADDDKIKDYCEKNLKK